MELYPVGVPRRSNLESELPDKNILHHIYQSRLKSFEGIGRLDTLSCPRPHFTGARRISQERLERAREEHGVTMRNERAGHTIFNHIRRAAVRATNHGLGMSHRFQEYKTESFSAAGQRKYIAVGITCEKLLLREAVEKTGMVHHAGFTSKLFEPRPVFPFTHENQRRVRHGLQDARQRGNQRVRAFISLGRVPTAHGENDPRAFREGCGA